MRQPELADGELVVGHENHVWQLAGGRCGAQAVFVRRVGTNGWKLQNHLAAAAQYEQRDPRRLRCICQQS